MLEIQKYSPQILQEYIESIDVYHFDEGVDVQLFPKGVFEIVFQNNNDFQHNTAYSSGWEHRPLSFVGGLHNKSYQVKSTGSSNQCIAIEFKPNTAKYFIPYKLSDFQNNLIDVFDIWGQEAQTLSQQIHQGQMDFSKIALIEDFFQKQFLAVKRTVIDQAVEQILAFNGFVEVNELAVKAGLSAAQFRKRFKEEVGISPSQYCKITRINTALTILEKEHNKSLTELTYSLGYFDQSHFIKDFKAVIGCSPKFFRSQN